MSGGSDRPRVLLVDDDPMILRLLEVNFRIGGFEIETAARGDAALELALASPPDAIVMDVMLPGMGGYDVGRRIRETPELVDVPLIFLTASVREIDPARDAALGQARWIDKPFDPTGLVAIVRRLVEERAAT